MGIIFLSGDFSFYLCSTIIGPRPVDAKQASTITNTLHSSTPVGECFPTPQPLPIKKKLFSVSRVSTGISQRNIVTPLYRCTSQSAGAGGQGRTQDFLKGGGR